MKKYFSKLLQTFSGSLKAVRVLKRLSHSLRSFSMTDFLLSGSAVKDYNSIKNDGVVKCENCGVETVPAQRHQRGVTPPSNEAHVDHVIPKSKGGSGTPNNGQVLCRDCNLKKGNK